ncbi:MAG: hypothetical protein JSU96_12725 [Acidobacteriota bacterium]|nr:MAG: hypothetical protein JSU96_12725 [Acidobacteriota bacterium]
MLGRTFCFSRVFLCAGVLLVGFTELLQATGKWHTVGPFGGVVNVAAVDPVSPSVLYIGSPGGLFRSTDSGQNWAAVNTELDIRTLVIDPLTRSILYAGTGTAKGVFRSTDEGRSWQPVNGGLTHAAAKLVIDPLNPSTLYAATWGGGIFRTADSGTTWVPVNNGLTAERFLELAINPVNPSILYAGAPAGQRWDRIGGLFRTIDCGQSWTRIDDFGCDQINTILIDPENPLTVYAGTGFADTYACPTGIFRSTDGGDSWSSINSGLPSPFTVDTLAADPLNPSILYAGNYLGKFVRSIDAGESWVVTAAYQPAFWLVIDPLNPSILYAGNKGGVFRSPDQGETWVEVNNGLIGGYQIRALAMDPKTHPTLYAGEDGAGMFRSPDAGQTWTVINNGLMRGGNVADLAIDPLNPAVLFTVSASGELHRSLDGGNSWKELDRIWCVADSVVAIDPKNPSTVYVATAYPWNDACPAGIFRSSDRGKSWVAVNSGLTTRDVRALAIDPIESSILYAGTGAGVFRSVDQGQSWTAASNGLVDLATESLTIDPITPSTLYAGTEGGVFRTTDQAQSWSLANGGLGSFVAEVLVVDPTTPTTLYAGTQGAGVFRTTDGGFRWTSMNQELTYLNVNDLLVDPVDPSMIYAGTAGGVFVYRPAYASTFYFPQVGDGTSGQIQFQSTLILVNTGPDSPVRVEFYSAPDGEPMALALEDLGTRSVFEFDLLQGESISLATPGTEALQVGYARILADEGVDGVAVFRRTDLATGIALYEAGVPASSVLNDFSLYVDSLGARDTGLALVYPKLDPPQASAQPQEANVTIRLVDRENNLVAERTLEDLEPGSQRARYIHELFEDPLMRTQAWEMQGMLQVESDQPVAAVTLRQYDEPSEEFPLEVPLLTTFPVVSGVPESFRPLEAGESSSLYFPQFGDGAEGAIQFQSTLILINTGPDSPVRLEFFRGPDGEPMALTLGELGVGSLFEFQLKQGSSISLQTPGTGALQVGYARVAGGPGLGGVVVFQRTDRKTRILLYEAGVPATQPLRDFTLFVDSLGSRDTGFALAYPASDTGTSPALVPDAHVTLQLYDKQHQLIAEQELEPLPEGRHMARFVHEIFDDPAVKAQAKEMEGILVITSDQPLAAVTLRQNDDPQKQFPDEVPILTAFPVMKGRP